MRRLPEDQVIIDRLDDECLAVWSTRGARLHPLDEGAASRSFERFCRS
jgi:hypothetical protein